MSSNASRRYPPRLASSGRIDNEGENKWIEFRGHRSTCALPNRGLDLTNPTSACIGSAFSGHLAGHSTAGAATSKCPGNGPWRLEARWALIPGGQGVSLLLDPSEYDCGLPGMAGAWGFAAIGASLRQMTVELLLSIWPRWTRGSTTQTRAGRGFHDENRS
jgi:hypothetical protein